MTIQNRQLNDRLGNFQRCAELAPEGTYDDVKAAAAAIDEAIESVRAIFRAHGLKVNGTDACRDLEASIYGYMLTSNPDDCRFPVGEGFGQHVDGPAGARIIRQAAANLEAFRATLADGGPQNGGVAR